MKTHLAIALACSAILAAAKSGKAQEIADPGRAAASHGMKWLAEHQMADGGWCFDHGVNNKHVGPVNNPGKEKSTTGATAIALLPFLAAGHTHQNGSHKDTVARGIKYLSEKAKVAGDQADLSDGGNLTFHGMATLVLCEVYGLTSDKAQAEMPQKAINFIVAFQDKEKGGWSAAAGQPCDMSVTRWQIVALKSGHLAYLSVPTKTVKGAIEFLNQMQKEDGAKYGRTAPGDDPTATAMGLLCRMDLGWKTNSRALRAGVDFLSQSGRSKNDLAFNYHATELMFRVGGESWTKWKPAVGEQLIARQSSEGTYAAEKGSWWTGGTAQPEGGRLYETALRCLTLEICSRRVRLAPLVPDADPDDF